MPVAVLQTSLHGCPDTCQHLCDLCAARNNHIKALQTNLATQKPLKVTRRVQGKDADEYVYCGLYEVR